MKALISKFLRHTLARRGIGLRKLGFRLDPQDVSQNMEYSLLKEIIGSDWPKIVVDVGANDGRLLSNSFNFIDNGWQGVLVEPNPGLHAAIHKNLSGKNYKLFPVALSGSEGQATLRFDKADDGHQLMATISQDKNSWFDQVLSGQEIQVKVRRLDDVLKEAGVPTDFSVLSVDTEGHDVDVLSGLGEWRPRIIISEIYTWSLETYRKKFLTLLNMDYLFLLQIGCNEIYIHKDFFHPGSYNFFGRRL